MSLELLIIDVSTTVRVTPSAFRPGLLNVSKMSACRRPAPEGYDSTQIRREISRLLSASSLRNNPFDWQLDVIKALLLGLNSVVIAGTGSGKTIPFILCSHTIRYARASASFLPLARMV